MRDNQMPIVPDFSGKVLSISLIDDDNNHDLVEPRFEMQGGRLFLLGLTPVGATRGDWSAGALCAVAWERVTDYFVFGSLEEYTKAIVTCTEAKEETSEAAT